MEEVKKIIFECVDSALSEFDFIDKEAFYQFVNNVTGSKFELTSDFERFHEILKNTYGKRHFLVDRKIVQILHERAKSGIYSQNEEVTAFGMLIEVFLKETKENLAAHQKTVEITEYTRKLQLEVKAAKKTVKDAERLAVIGQTAGMVGHDIRNPLQAIIGDVYLMRQEVDEMPDGDRKKSLSESISSVEENVSYINKIVSDLQDYTRPLTPSIEEFELAPLAKNSLASLNIPNTIKTTVQIPEHFMVKADKSYIRRVLTNLVNNAIQAMPEGGRLAIRAKHDSSVTITVEDTGVGIPEGAKQRLFTPLFTTKSKGQGLGLAVVKRLVEVLGGKITFESQEGKGTKFIIKLPTRERERENETNTH